MINDTTTAVLIVLDRSAYSVGSELLIDAETQRDCVIVKCDLGKSIWHNPALLLRR